MAAVARRQAVKRAKAREVSPAARDLLADARDDYAASAEVRARMDARDRRQRA